MQSLAAMAGLGLLILVPAAVGAQEGPPPAIIRSATIVERDMARTITTPARVVARNDARIAAEASGRNTFIAEAAHPLAAGGLIAPIAAPQARPPPADSRARPARAATRPSGSRERAPA